jgi:hypothetical protein
MILLNPITACINPVSGLLEKLIDEAHAERRRKHEERMQEIAMIANSNLRDDYVQQLLLDKFLAPIEKAQHKLQDAAKHAQWLAEMVNYYHHDHGATQEQGKEISGQLRILATKITEVNSLYDLKIIYKAATLFTHELSSFKHNDRKYSLERSVRDGILNILNTCIAVENNFQRRAVWTINGQDKNLLS